MSRFELDFISDGPSESQVSQESGSGGKKVTEGDLIKSLDETVRYLREQGLMKPPDDSKPTSNSH